MQLVEADGWMDGWTDGRKDGWTEEWMNGWMKSEEIMLSDLSAMGSVCSKNNTDKRKPNSQMKNGEGYKVSLTNG